MFEPYLLLAVANKCGKDRGTFGAKVIVFRVPGSSIGSALASSVWKADSKTFLQSQQRLKHLVVSLSSACFPFYRASPFDNAGTIQGNVLIFTAPKTRQCSFAMGRQRMDLIALQLEHALIDRMPSKLLV